MASALVVDELLRVSDNEVATRVTAAAAAAIIWEDDDLLLLVMLSRWHERVLLLDAATVDDGKGNVEQSVILFEMHEPLFPCLNAVE